MSLRNKLKRKTKAVSVTVDGETYYFAKLSALQKGRFDFQWSSYRESNGSSGEGLRGFVVAFCESDENGNLANDSGTGESASAEFIKVAEEYMDGDAAQIEPFFECAAVANGIIAPKETDNPEPEKN